MKKKYRKDITLDYKYTESPESEEIIDEVFSKIFSHIIQEQKRLRTYFKSDTYKKDYEYLRKKKSILVDFLSIH